MTTTDSLLRSFTASQMKQATIEILGAFLTPKNDGIIAVAKDNLLTAQLDVAHPEATLRSVRQSLVRRARRTKVHLAIIGRYRTIRAEV